MGLPVVIVPSGGLPVTEAANGYGTPVDVAANGYGMPVTIVPSGGLPVIGSGGGVPPVPAAPVNTVAPVASGTATEGQTLTVTNGTWTGSPFPTFGRQWRRSGVDIGGATSATYTLVSADIGATVACAVTGTNASGSATAVSNGIGPVVAAATAPAQMTAPALTASAAAISVDRAADPATGGSAITGYDLRHSTDQATWVTVAMTTDPQSVTGLTNGTLYYVQTRAKNAIGDGAYSASATATPAAGGGATFDDDFTGDGNLTGRTGWTFVSGTTGGAVTSAGQLGMTTSTESVWQSQDLGTANHWMESKLVNVGVNGPFVALRLTDISNWVGVRNSASAYAVFKRAAGALTQLSSTTPTPALNDIMRLEASGSLVTLYINGVVVASAQNVSISDVPSTTRQGVIARTATRSPYIDDYKTGPL